MHRRGILVLAAIIWAIGAVTKAAEGDWPWWRGPALDGIARASAPTKWSATENVAWVADVPGRGHSSPVVCGEHVFLTSADEQAGTQSLVAFARKSGKKLWVTAAHQQTLPKKHPKNSHASATLACDGERVYAAFVSGGALHVTAVRLNGAIDWQRPVGTFRSEHGYACSPVLYKSLVIVNGDSLQGSFLAALERRTGEVAWKIDRPSIGRHGNYATPVVAYVSGKDQLLLHGMSETTSYDPATGKQFWRCDGPAEVAACTPAASDSLVFSSAGFPEKELLAIRADGTGDVTQTHVVWRTKQGVTYVPSPLYHEGRLYIVNDGGVATCFDAKTGKQIWQERLGGAFSSSPVLAGNKIYIANEAGKLYVLKASPQFEALATNDLADGGFATPAVAGGQIFIRTNTKLYCIGK